MVFPTLLKGLMRNVFHAPDFFFPPLCILASLAESICKWYHLSAYCHSPPAHPFIKCLQLGASLPCPPCSIVPGDPGEGAVCACGEGRWVSPTAPGAGAWAGVLCSWEGTITQGEWQLPLPVWQWQMTLQGQQPWASPQTWADMMG